MAQKPGKPETQPGKQPSKWRPSPPELVELFDRLGSALPPQAERRKMFGYPCAFTNDQLFFGLHQETMLVRLSESDRAEFLAIEGARIFEPMPGRRMKEYVVIPPPMLTDEEALRAWTMRAFTYARSLGPKQSRKRSK